MGEPPCGAEPRIELGPALQQADALPTEPRRTMSYAAPYSWRILLKRLNALKVVTNEKGEALGAVLAIIC